jgi:hypothetical protein
MMHDPPTPARADSRPTTWTTPMPCPGSLSLTTAALRAGVHRTSLWRWVRSGVAGVRLAARKVGGAWQIQAGDLDAFIEEMTRRATAGNPAPVLEAGQSPEAVRKRARAAREAMRNLGA